MYAIFIFVMLVSYEATALCLPSVKNPYNEMKMDNYVIENVAKDFTEMADENLPSHEQVTVAFEYLNDEINAEITKTPSGPVITVLGGLLNHPRMNQNVLSLLLCHELGHYLGGPPLKSRNGWSSTEGQADYYSGLKCAREFLSSEEEFLKSALTLTSIYAEVTREPWPQLDQCDTSVVQRTFYGYPKVQCRLDTIIAGWRNEKRPSCWYFN